MNTTEPDDSHSLPEDAADQRAQALLWLTESAPLSAAPADSLQQVRARLGLRSAEFASLPGPRRWRLAALTGWGAAAALLAVLLSDWGIPARPKNGGTVPPPQNPNNSSRTVASPPPSPATVPGTVEPITSAEELRRQIAELREALKSPAPDRPGTHRPVIHELHPPGSPAPASGSERILDIIAGALEADLRRQSPNTSGEVIIESGWAKWTSSLPPDTVFRHRQFPKAEWASLGLLAGPEGQFLDPATGWLWTPESGSADYTGTIAPAGLDRSAFKAAPEMTTKAVSPAQVAAAGYVVAGGGQTLVSLSNLPPVPRTATLSIAGTGSGSTFTIPASSYSSEENWNFSGVINQSVDFSEGFTLQMTSAPGQNVTLLSTGGGR